MQYSNTALLLLVNPHQNNGTTCPTYVFIVWKEDASLPAMFNLLCSSTNQQLFKKNFWNQSSHYENYGQFPEAIMYLLQTRYFSWRTKMNGTQRRALVSPWRMHCMYSGMAKDTAQAEATSNSERIKWIMQIWRHQAGRQSVSQSVSQKFC